MFAYVRVCSDMFAYREKMAARRQGHQPWIIFVFRVGNRTPVFQPHDGKGREWDGSDEGDRSNRLAGTLAPAKTKKPVPDGQILRLIALIFSPSLAPYSLSPKTAPLVILKLAPRDATRGTLFAARQKGGGTRARSV
jgi:hypothetical protein